MGDASLNQGDDGRSVGMCVCVQGLVSRQMLSRWEEREGGEHDGDGGGACMCLCGCLSLWYTRNGCERPNFLPHHAHAPTKLLLLSPHLALHASSNFFFITSHTFPS